MGLLGTPDPIRAVGPRDNSSGEARIRMVRSTAFLSGLQSFFRWWLGELAGFVPARLGAAVGRRKRVFVFDLSGPEILLLFRSPGRDRVLARLGPVGPEEDAGDPGKRARASVQTKIKGATTVALRLASHEALLKSLSLPLAAGPDLREALRHQISRQTPFAPEDVHFDYTAVEHETDSQQVNIELAVVPQSTVERAIARAAAWGLEPDLIEIDGTGVVLRLGAGGAGPTGVGARRLSARRLAIAGAAGLLAVAALYLPLNWQGRIARDLSNEVAVAKVEAEKAAALGRELDRLVNANRYLASKKQDTAPVVRILDELARLLTDETYLFQFQLNGRKIQLAGYSTQAASLIPAVDQSRIFRAPSFRSPVTSAGGDNLERFLLVFEMEGPGQ